MTVAQRTQHLPLPKDAAAEHWQRVMTGLRDPIKPVRARPMYQLGLLLVLTTMFSLAVVYLALIAAVAAGIAWYSVHALVFLIFAPVPARRPPFSSFTPLQYLLA